MPQGESKVELWWEDANGYRQLEKWDNYDHSGGKKKDSVVTASGETLVFETHEVEKITWDSYRTKTIGQEVNYWRLKRAMEECRLTVVYQGGQRVQFAGYVSDFKETAATGQAIKGQVEFLVDTFEELR